MFKYTFYLSSPFDSIVRVYCDLDSMIILSAIGCSNDGWSRAIYSVNHNHQITLTPQKHQKIYYATDKDLRNCDSIYLESGHARIILENRLEKPR